MRAGDLPLRGTDRSFAEVPGLSLVGEPWIPVLAGSTAATSCRCGVHLWPGSGLAYSSFRSVKVSDFAAALYKHGEHRQLYAVSSFGSRALPTSELRPTILNRTARSNDGTNRSRESASGRERRCRWKMLAGRQQEIQQTGIGSWRRRGSNGRFVARRLREKPRR